MLQPDRFDLDVWRNAPFPDGSNDIWALVDNGEPYNLTGKLILMQVRLYEEAGGAALIDLSSATVSGDRIEITSAVDGEFKIHIAKATHEDLPDAAPGQPKAKRVAEFEYDLKMGANANSAEVFLYGVYRLHSGVTR